MTATRRFLGCILSLSLCAVGCQSKKNDDVPPPTLPSAVSVPVAASAASLVPEVPSAVPSEHAEPGHIAAGAKVPKGHDAGPVAATSATASATPPASAAEPAIPGISAQCQTTCRNSYKDCMTPSGTAAAIDILQKCREALSTCFAACK